MTVHIPAGWYVGGEDGVTDGPFRTRREAVANDFFGSVVRARHHYGDGEYEYEYETCDDQDGHTFYVVRHDSVQGATMFGYMIFGLCEFLHTYGRLKDGGR